MTTTTTERQVNNGVNVEALIGAREALTEAPEAAKFTWRANCKWINGTHSQSTVKGFFGLGEAAAHGEACLPGADDDGGGTHGTCPSTPVCGRLS